MKKILLTGSSGMLGSNIARELAGRHEIYGVYRKFPNKALKKQFKADLTDQKDLNGVRSAVRPDYIIHCAALTNVDYCEKDYELAYRTNALVTKNLVSGFGPETKFIYISTDSVFDGTKGNYSETDNPRPVNNYARSKLEGERLLEGATGNHITIRTNIFGWSMMPNGSFAEWIYKSLSDKKPIKMFIDVIFSPVLVNTLSLYIEKLLESDYTGRLHIASRNSISKYDFGVLLADLFNFDKKLITPISVDSFEFKAKRPKNTSLNTSRATKILGPMPMVERELDEFKRRAQ